MIKTKKHYKIQFGDKIFEASEYQDEIFNNVQYGTGNMIINAAAGSSKTTTIVNCIGMIPDNEKILYVAFNKNIVEAITDKIGKKNNVNIMTFHSLGFSILTETCTIGNINEYKYKNYIKNNISILSTHSITDLHKGFMTYLRNIENLCDYARYYSELSENGIARIAWKYGLVLIDDEIKICQKVLRWGMENYKDEIDFTDMLWLPNILNLITKRHQYDRIFIDEAQDTSVIEQMLIEKTFKRGARLTVVGDTNQSINIWCGASEEAIDQFKQIPNTKEFLLPISYRCPKKIVEIATEYSDNIKASDDAIEGIINYDVNKYLPTDGDMVLCRTTAPLIKLHIDYLRGNKKSYIRGFENIKEQYLSLIENTQSKTIDKNCITSNGMFPELYKELLRQIEYVEKNYNLTYEDALEDPSIFSLYDAIEGIDVLSEGLKTVQELKDKINAIFNGYIEDGIQLSTAHKAKGLEADNVYILRPSLMPLSFAKKEWEIKTERNLLYVAITRSKKTLNFIKEDVGDRYKLKGIKKHIVEIKDKLKYNSDNDIKENKDIITYMPTISKKLGEEKEKVSIINKKKKGGMKMAMLLK